MSCDCGVRDEQFPPLFIWSKGVKISSYAWKKSSGELCCTIAVPKSLASRRAISVRDAATVPSRR